jgi:NADPH:quinone reductase-like Zn-dependent oxidoreductase
MAKPFIMRFFTGLFKPRSPFTGTDFAGKIEAVGRNVTTFKPGDQVWGFADDAGSHAQYIKLAANKAIMIMPNVFSYEQAAASAEGAYYALNFMNKVKISAGKKVLLNGATGAIGSALLQFLKHVDAHVTAVCNTKNMELVRSLGADQVIDFTKEDFTKDTGQYDFVFDAVGKSTFARCKPLLKKGGIYISSDLGPGCQNPFLAIITAILPGKKVIFPIPVNIKGSLVFISELIEKEKFKPVIDRQYPLEDIVEAFKYVASGQKTGHVLITME